jgi:hypothetical protein
VIYEKIYLKNEQKSEKCLLNEKELSLEKLCGGQRTHVKSSVIFTKDSHLKIKQLFFKMMFHIMFKKFVF